MPKTRQEIDEQIKKLKDDIFDLERKREKIKELTPEQELAVSLHSRFCNFNHTDQCSWEYEVDKNDHKWNGTKHQYWLGKAQNVLSNGYKYDTALEILRAYDNLRKAMGQ